MKSVQFYPLLVIVLFFFSLFPIPVFAQIKDPVEPDYQTCVGDSGALGRMYLDEDEALAIQNIVKQDVATSAEKYQRQKLEEEAGLEKPDYRKETVKTYKFYFMGPDGPVYYDGILGNRMDEKNGWFIGTNIYGKIEYAGGLAENVPTCPSVPLRVITSQSYDKYVCDNAETDVEETKAWYDALGSKVKTLIADASYFVARANVMEDFKSLETLEVGQSRMMGSEMTVTMTSSPGSSAIFILPQHLVMYTASMKALDTLDGVMALFSLTHSLKGVGASLKKAKGMLSDIKNLFRSTADAPEAIRNTLNVKRPFRAITTDSLTALDSSLDDRIKAASRFVDPQGQGRLTADGRALIQQGVDEATSSVDEAVDTLERERKMWRGMHGGVEDPTIQARYNQYANPVTGGLQGEVNEAADDLVKKVTGQGMPGGRPASAMEQRAAKDEFINKLREVQQLNEDTLTNFDTLLPVSSSCKKQISSAGHMVYNRLRDSHIGQLLGGARQNPVDLTAGIARRTAFAELLMGTFGRALYTGWTRFIVLSAFGLHLINDAFLRQGYFELAAPGISMRWDKESIGEVYRDDSIIMLLATNTQVPALTRASIPNALGAETIGKFITRIFPSNLSPLAHKAQYLGDIIIFGGTIYEPGETVGIVTYPTKNKGITRIDTLEREGYNFFELQLMKWDNHAFVEVEDPITMQERVQDRTNSSVVTAIGVWTHRIDLYHHLYGDPDELKKVYTSLDPLVQRLNSWDFIIRVLITESIVYLLVGTYIPAAMKALSGASLVNFLPYEIAGAGLAFMTAKTTDMKDLGECVRDNTCKREDCGSTLKSCLGKQYGTSAALAVFDFMEMALLTIPGGQIGTIIMTLLELSFVYQKMKVSQECLADLMTCQEDTFTIIGVAEYHKPAVQPLSGELQTLKDLGIDDQTMADFLNTSAAESVLGDAVEAAKTISQMQINVHGEMNDVTGRLLMNDIYYAHLKDATIQWITGDLGIDLCPVNPDTGDAIPEACIHLLGDTITDGLGNVIVKDPLVIYKWLDENLPALIIPTEAVTVDLPTVWGKGCSEEALVSIEPNGEVGDLNEDLVLKFNSLGFSDVQRMLGRLEVIETDEGSIFPDQDYEGNPRFTMDLQDGSYDYSEISLEIKAGGNVVFNSYDTGEHRSTLKSAVFNGGAIVRREDALTGTEELVLILRYFRAPILGQQWAEEIAGPNLFASDTGDYDVDGDCIIDDVNGDGEINPISYNPVDMYSCCAHGIDASNTNIPGGEKMGVITQVVTDEDADGQTSGYGWFKEKDPATGKDYWYFKTWIHGKIDMVFDVTEQCEVRIGPDGTIIAVDMETGEKRIIGTTVDEMGRTHITMEDGEGNKLLEDALVTWIKGTGGAIRYNPTDNSYIFVNGQPIEVNNDFKTNGFNPITGRTTPPLLQPSVANERKYAEEYRCSDGRIVSDPDDCDQPLFVPTAPREEVPFFVYIVALLSGLFAVHVIFKKPT
jgi:hypothetical protein